jgi:DNA-binding phage protein
VVAVKSKKARKVYLYSQSDSETFFKIGAQYLAAARYAISSGLMPLAGNLYHHGIELLLKGTLATSMSKSELRYTLGHNLDRAWREFKKRNNDPQFTRFDPLISDLHRFEIIRYPEIFEKKGAPKLIPNQVSGNSKYALCLEDLERIVEVIFDKGSRDPRAYCSFSAPGSAQSINTRDIRAKTRLGRSMDKDELLSSQQRVLQISEVIALLRTDVQRRGGIVAWSKATGIHRTTVSKVLSDVQEPTNYAGSQIAEDDRF